MRKFSTFFVILFLALGTVTASMTLPLQSYAQDILVEEVAGVPALSSAPEPSTTGVTEVSDPELPVEPSFIGEILNTVSTLPVIGQFIGWFLLIVPIAASIAALPFVPVGKPGSIWWYIRKYIIDLAALNVGNAKNKLNG